MKKLIEVVQEAENRVAIGHFNIADLVLLKSVFQAAHEIERAGHGWHVAIPSLVTPIFHTLTPIFASQVCLCGVQMESKPS